MNIKKLGLMLVLSFLITMTYLGSVSAGSIYQIDDSNYANYFDANGNILASSAITAGDTLKFGNLNDKKFNINKKLFITSNNPNNQLINSYFEFSSGSDGSSLTGINLTNIKAQNNGSAVISINENNILLENNIVFFNGPFNVIGGFVVQMNSKNSKLIHNTFKRTGGSTCLYLYGSTNENIDVIGNNISSGDMTHQGGNVLNIIGTKYNIAGNNITGSPSNICWGIKLEANESVIDKNDISNTQIGISTNDASKNVISNNNIHDFDATLSVDGTSGTLFYAIGIEGKIDDKTIVQNNTITGVKTDSRNIFSIKLVNYIAIMSHKSVIDPNHPRNPSIIVGADLSKFCSSNKISMYSTNSWAFDELTYNGTNLNAFSEKNNIIVGKVKGPIVHGGAGIYS
jgi:parallel beta-helix repeat protein